MQTLTKMARAILDRMEPDRSYETSDLRAFVPDASPETLRELMHELWINREVERAGDSGWQRHRSASPQSRPAHAGPDAGDLASVSGHGQTKVVKPEELFDHDSFADFFR